MQVGNNKDSKHDLMMEIKGSTGAQYNSEKW